MKKKALIISTTIFFLTAGILTAVFLNRTKQNDSWLRKDGMIMYIKPDGKACLSEWYEIDDAWYYFDATGNMATGDYIIDGSTYIFGDDGKLQSCWITLNNHKVYLRENRLYATGWNTIDDKTYYMKSDGECVTGLYTVDGIEYYFNEDGSLANGWTKNGEKEFYVNSNGIITSGFNMINGTKYYLNEDGTRYDGWLNDGGYKYYVNNGIPVQNEQTINGNSLIFNRQGQLLYKDDAISSLSNVPSVLSDKEIESRKAYRGRGQMNTNIKKDSVIEGIGGYTPDSKDKAMIQDVMDDINSNSKYSIGFVMYNLYTDQGIACNIDNMVYSASCIKGPYVASLVSEKNDLVANNSNNLRLIIEESDNKLYSNLRRTYGRNCFITWCEEANVDMGVTVYNYPFITARDLAKLWVQNYYFFNTDSTGTEISNWYTSPNESAIYTVLGKSDRDYTSLATTPSNNTLSATVSYYGKGYKTQSKAGWIVESGYSATNDGGIIYPTDSDPYIITICTDMPSDMTSLKPVCEMLHEIYKKTVIDE